MSSKRGAKKCYFETFFVSRHISVEFDYTLRCKKPDQALIFFKILDLSYLHSPKEVSLSQVKGDELLRLVSLNGENITQSLYRSQPVYPSIGKYISSLKESLGIEAEMAKLDSSGSRFEILKALSSDKPYVSFENSIYIPMKAHSKIWGFVKIKNSKSVDSKTIEKAVSSLQESVPSELYIEKGDHYKENQLIALLTGMKDREGYKLVLEHFHNDKYCSFINLSEWINLKQPFSLKYLRGFRNSLFYIDEVMDLSRSQRATLALYSMLPSTIKKSALVINSRYTDEQIKKSLSPERGFLNAFLDKKITLDEIKVKRPLS